MHITLDNSPIPIFHSHPDKQSITTLLDHITDTKRRIEVMVGMVLGMDPIILRIEFMGWDIDGN